MAGIVIWQDDRREGSDYGLVVESVDTRHSLFMVYEALPTEATLDNDSDFPPWAIHYIEAAVLERAYGADTDGFMPTMRDYWKLRKELGIEALKRIKTARTKDRDFLMGGARVSRSPGPRLPDGYPAV